MFLTGAEGVWKQDRPPVLVPSLSTPRPHPVCGRWWPSWLWSSGPDRLSTSPNCSTIDQHSCTDVGESRIVLAILHQTVSYLDCIVLVVVSTNVMRELLI